MSARQPGAAHPLDDIASAHGSAARQAVHDACAQAVGFACETEPPNTFEFPPRLVHGGESTPELEGQVRNSVRRFAEQVLRIEQSSQGEGEARRLVLSRPSDYNLPLDEDPNVRKCFACGTLGGAGVLFTSSQFQRVRPRCKPCTQRRALEDKRAQVEQLRAKCQREDAVAIGAWTCIAHLFHCAVDHMSAPCAAAAPLGHVLALPTALAIAECRAHERELRAEEDRRGLGLRAGFLV